MKKLLLIIPVFFIVASVNAQKIDRSKPPKAGPAPVLSIKDPVEFKMDNGMTVIVVENHKFPKVSANLRIDAGPVFEGDKAGTLNLMGSMLSEGTKAMTKAQFDEAVDQMGAEIGLTAGGGSASALTRYFEKTFMLMAEALRNPAMEQASLDKLKSMALTALKASERSATAISGRVVKALSYGRHTAMGEFNTEQSLSSITLQDVKDAYEKYITPSRSYLTFVGDITPAQAKSLAEKAFGDWKGNTLVLPTIANVANPGQTEIDLVDVPSAVQSEITVTNLVNLPMSSPDFFPVLLANQILGGGSGRLFQNLREKHGFTYGSYSSIGPGRYQTTFSATAQVRNDKVDSAVVEILKEINRIRTEKVSDKELAETKALYSGNFALGLEDPAVPATFASNILINGLDKDFYRNYLKKVSEVTIDDIQRVAQKYFSHDNARIVVVGKESVVKPGLEKLGYPIKLYDKYADPVTAQPAASAEVPANVSAKEIIEKYINAIGGADVLKTVTSVHSTGTINIQGMDMDMEEKQMAPNLSYMAIVMNGQPIVEDVFDGKSGWKIQMGQKMDYEPEELKIRNEKKGLFDQLFYLNGGGYSVQLAGTEKVDGKDAYKLVVKSPSGHETTEWYDKTTGYMLKSITTMEVGGQSVSQTSEYSNYTKVENIFLPYTIIMTVDTPMGMQEMKVQVKNVQVNKGVTKDDFK